MGDYNCDSPLTLVQAAADVMEEKILINNNKTMLVIYSQYSHKPKQNHI